MNKALPPENSLFYHLQPSLHFSSQDYSEGSDDSGYELDDLEAEIEERALVVDGKDLKDFPARYFIPAIRKHEFPVIGVYVDSRLVPGFCYKVRPIQDEVRIHKIVYLSNECIHGAYQHQTDLYHDV